MRVEGSGASPPAGDGGALGYGEFLEVINDSESERHREMLEWCGGRFDPEAFDLEMVNRRLGRKHV